MKIRSTLALLAPVLLCLTAPEARAGRSSLFAHVWGDCVVVTDMTEAGRALTPPTREKPVYFLGESLGTRLGWMAGDRLPDSKEMGRFVARILAKQGYLAAQPGVHEPELFLVLQWGRVAPRSGDLLWFLGYDPHDDPAAAAYPHRLFGSQVLGPEVWRRDFRPREVETVLNYASDDIYGILISAFEYKSAHTADPVVLWQTRIALPANGKSMPEAITAMVQVAGSQIGRETIKPVLRNTDDRYTTELGELEVIGFEEDETTGGAGK